MSAQLPANRFIWANEKEAEPPQSPLAAAMSDYNYPAPAPFIRSVKQIDEKIGTVIDSLFAMSDFLTASGMNRAAESAEVVVDEILVVHGLLERRVNSSNCTCGQEGCDIPKTARPNQIPDGATDVPKAVFNSDHQQILRSDFLISRRYTARVVSDPIARPENIFRERN